LADSAPSIARTIESGGAPAADKCSTIVAIGVAALILQRPKGRHKDHA
jgi:hypothetical protein